MSATVQALCDRFILEVANVRFLGEILPGLSLERIVPASGWTVRQTFNHIDRSMDEYPELLTRLLQGEPAHPEGFDRDAENAALAANTGVTPLGEILTSLGSARDRFLGMLEANSDALENAQSGDGHPVLEIVARWAHHSARHCLELIEALPELCSDPLLLTWLLESDLGEEEDVQKRRNQLRQVALAAYGRSEEESHAP